MTAAKRSGQTKGWTVYTESSIFGGMSTWGAQYTVANAWYCTHLWDHYRYTLDKDYLKRAFPAIWSSAEFWMERLKKDTRVKDGKWVCPNEWSPEHGPRRTVCPTLSNSCAPTCRFAATRSTQSVPQNSV